MRTFVLEIFCYGMKIDIVYLQFNMIVKTPKKVVNEKWILSNPSDYKRWSSDEGFSISNGEKDNSYGSLTCPLCRKKYIRIK